MSDQLKISAEKRSEFGKGAARRIRRAHKIPAVLYGHGTDPIHVTLPGHETLLALRHSNAVLSLDVAGEEHLALVKDVQRDPIRPVIEHVDLVLVRRGEKVVVEVAVHVEGEAAEETVVTLENAALTVEAEALNIPESFTVSVDGVAGGTQILASQVELPSGVTLVTDPETLVVNVTQAISADALEAELADAEAEAGIEHDEPEAPEGDAADGAEGGSGQGSTEG